MGNEGGRQTRRCGSPGGWKGKKRRRGQIFLGTYYVRGGDREFGILFASRFKFVYTKSESDLFGTSYFFKLTFNKDVVSYTKVVLLTKTSFIGDRFNILLSVHQVVRMFLGGARTLFKKKRFLMDIV